MFPPITRWTYPPSYEQGEPSEDERPYPMKSFWFCTIGISAAALAWAASGIRGGGMQVFREENVLGTSFEMKVVASSPAIAERAESAALSEIVREQANAGALGGRERAAGRLLGEARVVLVPVEAPARQERTQQDSAAQSHRG